MQTCFLLVSVTDTCSIIVVVLRFIMQMCFLLVSLTDGCSTIVVVTIVVLIRSDLKRQKAQHEACLSVSESCS